jgi:hypothetical protein
MRFAAAFFTSRSPWSHFQVPDFGSEPRHSGKRRTVETPAADILGNQSA